MEIVQQKGASQKELITLKNKIQLKQLVVIKLEGIKPIGSLQEVKGDADVERSVRVFRGSSGNPLSVRVFSDDGASYYGRRFYLGGNFGPSDASRVVGAVKDGKLTLYELRKDNETFSANYAKTLEIIKETGAELADYKVAIPAISQALESSVLLTEAKDALKGIWFYVQGKGKDLGNLEDRIYTWDKAKEDVPTGSATNAIEAVKAELQVLQHGIETKTQEFNLLKQNKAELEGQIAEITAAITKKVKEEKRLKEALVVLERKE